MRFSPIKLLKLSLSVFLPSSLLITSICGCRQEVNREAGEDEKGISIRVIQNWEELSHPPLKSVVEIKGAVVTAVDTYDEDGRGHVGSIWIGELDGSGEVICGKWCGITVYKPSIQPVGIELKAGDIVDVVGQYDEFVYNDDGSPPDPQNLPDYHFNHLSEISNATVVKVGEWSEPHPFKVEAYQIKMEPVSQQEKQEVESFEGVLVIVKDLTISSEYDKYGQFETEEGVMIEDDLFHFPCNEYEGSIVGVHLKSVTGVVSWFGIKSIFGNYKILPRSIEDFEFEGEFEGCN